MRTVVSLTVLAVAAGPALAQQSTRVTTQLPARAPDTVRIVTGPATTERAMAIKMALAELSARNRKQEVELKALARDTSPEGRKRYEQLAEELANQTFELLKTQNLLVRECVMLRPDELDVPGTIGMSVNKEVRLSQDMVRRTLTMMIDADTLRVRTVEAGSPAEKAGVRAGDVWKALNGQPMIGTVRFNELLTPGALATLKLMRDGREFELAVTVAAKKSAFTDACGSESALNLDRPMFFADLDEIKKRMPTPVKPAPSAGRATMYIVAPATSVFFGGASIQTLDDDWRQLLKLQGAGVVIADLAPGGPAEAAGLRKFDVIKHVNGTLVASAGEFRRLMSQAQQRTLTLTVAGKDGATRTVTYAR